MNISVIKFGTKSTLYIVGTPSRGALHRRWRCLPNARRFERRVTCVYDVTSSTTHTPKWTHKILRIEWITFGKRFRIKLNLIKIKLHSKCKCEGASLSLYPAFPLIHRTRTHPLCFIVQITPVSSSSTWLSLVYFYHGFYNTPTTRRRREVL